jgi:hypothetical protein
MLATFAETEEYCSLHLQQATSFFARSNEIKVRSLRKEMSLHSAQKDQWSVLHGELGVRFERRVILRDGEMSTSFARAGINLTPVKKTEMR